MKVNWQKKAQTNKYLQTMLSKKVTALFIITLHIFSHFAKTFNLHKVYWLYLTLVTWISLSYRLQSVHCHLDVWVNFWSRNRDGVKKKYRVIDFSWRSCVLHKSRDTQKSMDCKQTKKKIGDLYVNIKSRVDS